MGECGIPPPVYAISGGGTYSGRALSSEKRLSAVMRYIWGTWGYLSPNVQCMDTQDAVSGGGKRIGNELPPALNYFSRPWRSGQIRRSLIVLAGSS